VPTLNFLEDGSLNPDRKRKGRCAFEGDADTHEQKNISHQVLMRSSRLPPRSVLGTSSRYRGVSKRSYRSGGPASWVANINLGGRHLYLGSFTSEEAAARAYDRCGTMFIWHLCRVLVILA
jgi:hypothetical protein